MVMTINKLKISSIILLLPLLSRLKFHAPLCIIWLQSWGDFSTSIQSLCGGFCARELHCTCTRYPGNLGICLIVIRLNRATACFSSLVFLFYVIMRLFDLHTTPLFQTPVDLYSIPLYLLIISFLHYCQLPSLTSELCDTQYLLLTLSNQMITHASWLLF